MVDIGGGTTDVAVFLDGAIRHTMVIPVGGDHVTNDIAVALRTSTQNAEQIKREYASVSAAVMQSDDMIPVLSISNRPAQQIPLRALSQVVHARYEELFSMVVTELRRTGFDEMIPGGIVLTGGASKVAGCLELAEMIFQMPVRIGFPQHVSGLVDVREDPTYATGVGLLLYGLKQQDTQYPFVLKQGLPSMWSRMKSWFQGNF